MTIRTVYQILYNEIAVLVKAFSSTQRCFVSECKLLHSCLHCAFCVRADNVAAPYSSWSIFPFFFFEVPTLYVMMLVTFGPSLKLYVG